ncbi:MAG: DUF523 domain-containing protein [Christensenellaceae bacterium]|nr:DUF523 domain-containing protein [Christensenellaceae bacterium]
MIWISKCLTGEKCRYDGGSRPNGEIVSRLAKGLEAVCFCPECEAGLPTPRTPSEIVGGDGSDVLGGKAKVLTKDGKDRTEEFVRGAQLALAAAKKAGVTAALMKSKSPSCGVGCIYDGSFTGRLKAGSGVTAALFKENGIEVVEVD